MQQYSASEFQISRLRRVAEEAIARLESTMSPFENSLRSSKEVRPLSLLTDDDWYRRDEVSGKNKLVMRARSFLSCVCLVALYLAKLPFQLPELKDLLVDEFVDPAASLITKGLGRVESAIKRSRPVRVQKSTRLKKPPGTLLLRITDFFFSKKTVTLTFKPLVADWQTEYFDSLQEKRYWKSRWISARYYWAFAKACGLSRISDALKRIVPALR
jgi:hypothetical protein